MLKQVLAKPPFLILRSGLILVLLSALGCAANSLTVVSSASDFQPVAPASIVTAFGSDLATTILSATSATWPVSLRRHHRVDEGQRRSGTPGSHRICFSGAGKFSNPPANCRGSRNGDYFQRRWNGFHRNGVSRSRCARLFAANAMDKARLPRLSFRWRPMGRKLRRSRSPVAVTPLSCVTVADHREFYKWRGNSLRALRNRNPGP